MPLSDTLRRRRDDLRYKLRDLLERWRLLPRLTQAKIAAACLVFAALCLGAAYWLIRPPAANEQTARVAGEVVLYTTADDPLVKAVTDAFEADTGITVRVVGDTEATKVTGLVERLLGERARPRADVWWSSDLMGTATLAAKGALDPFVTKAEADFPKGWPAGLRAADKTWYGFAQRARVIAFNTNRLSRQNVPTRLQDLTDPAWAGKVGMARPQFGTTRNQLAALIAVHGEETVRAWLSAMMANGVRLYNGNAAVVQALSVGEIEIGLTDTDDVWSGQRNAWPVDMVVEAVDPPGRKVRGLRSEGPLVIPNTVGRVRGGPHPNEARRLADYLLSAPVERLLAASDSRNIPIRPDLAKEFIASAVASPWSPDPARILEALPIADRLTAELVPPA